MLTSLFSANQHPYFVGVLVFVLTAFVDLAWAFYIRTLATDAGIKAAIWSSVIVLCGAFSMISYVEDRWMLLPAVAGAFVGTLLCKRVETFFEKPTQ